MGRSRNIRSQVDALSQGRSFAVASAPIMPAPAGAQPGCRT
jgi:hypothetical protein